MELCWSKVRQHIRRDPMKEHDGLVERIKEAAAQLTLGDCIGWIQQSAANWDQFLNKSVA
ncbi:hypothetical protein BD560DRAFT_325527 [Blakeslea trispora]|nr:hypothetical protein BD560DRAFT_325527 [Blakeslea trispora]